MTVTLITPTAYSRHRGCDEKAVRKAIAAGRISTINGMIDPVVADIQWKQNTRARGDSGTHKVAALEAAAVQATPSSAPEPPIAAAPAAQPEPAPKDDGEYSVNRARRERFEADLAEMKLREQQGDLVRVVEVRAEMSKRIGQVRMNLLQLPARLAPLLATETDQAKVYALLDGELRSVLSSVTQGSYPT